MDKNLHQIAKAPMIALINPQAPKGRPDINHGCNPWTETTPANHGCNPCAVTHRAKTLLLLLLLAMTTAAQAQSTFGGGSGTQADPYLIYNTDQLDQLAADVNNGNPYENVWFKLMDDLDYTGKPYTPIGGTIYDDGTYVLERQFRGGFWGNNHSINNVTINSQSPYYFGLFGFLGYGGKIYELTLGGNSSITTTGFAGGIAGEVFTNAEIISCHVGENVVISALPVAAGSAYNPMDLGGIAGYSSGKILGCVSKATINNGGIAETENLGGIVGRLGSSGSVEYCRFLGTVEGTLHVGDVAGSSSGTLNYNYYHTTVRHGGVDGNDTDGAKWMGTVSFGEQVSGSLPEATFEDGGTPYFGAGMAMVMSNMNYDTPAGFVAESATYSANGVALVEDGAYHRFTMPDADVTITGSATLKRDIGYGGWVTIDIPSQACTGDPLTPVVTVTDSKTGLPVTLVEGMHYTVTLPDGGCIDWGDYTITITGIGDFGGQTTAVFTITLPGGGSGTETDPYIILTTDDLDALAAAVNGGDGMNGKHFRLLADLDYSGKTYTPIGIVTPSCRFQGTFDGYGHSISNVVINEPDQDYQGLFAFIHSSGTVKNLVLGAGSSITGGYYVGGIAGLCGGTITGCTVSEGVSISGNQEVGGIAGRINGPLSGCVNKASVSGSNCVGGIAGYSVIGTITDNLNLGAVSSNTFGINEIGGIIGYNNSNNAPSNNYYAGACNVGGIEGSDVAGQAMRGYTIEVGHPLGISLEGSTGLLYEGKVYAGKNQEVIVGLEIPNSTITPQCYLLSAGSIADNGDGTHTITMPAENITVSGNIVEIDGLHYELSCDGSNTATVIQNDAYASTLEDNFAVPYGFTLGETYYEVVAIGPNAFEGCTGITELYLDENMTVIGSEAFKNCTGLTKITAMPLVPPTAAEDAFSGVPTDIPIEVAFCSQYDYSVATGWSSFSNFQGGGPCEHTFMGMEDNLWSNPNNWMGGMPDANSTVGIYGNCEIDVDMTVKSVTIGDFYMEDGDEIIMDKLVVKSGKTLTTNNFIYTTGDATHFVIEDGAQVYHPNAGAKATVQKAVSAYSTQSGVNNGWHLIALPITGSINVDSVGNLIGGEYDLYAYDESTAYWTNRKTAGSDFAALEATKGYLYAHGEDVTLEFSGTLQNSSDTISVPLSYTEESPLSGFNLVGNPFPCEAYLDRAYYVLGANGTEINPVAIPSTVPVPPCTAVFVKAVDEGDSAVFTRVAP